MIPKDEFKKYANKHIGISSMSLERYASAYNNYISPTIIEERQMNVAQMDVFSRLMMDRIIFWVFQSLMMLPILYRPNYYSLNRLILLKIFRYI